mmetsp:Transcript_11718/g.30846  ORF Transcript_11718/g.30846 Transcript_11718/m.30846 type:complete len:231 (-) Transcript_11718:42-734(-)
MTARRRCPNQASTGTTRGRRSSRSGRPARPTGGPKAARLSPRSRSPRRKPKWRLTTSPSRCSRPAPTGAFGLGLSPSCLSSRLSLATSRQNRCTRCEPPRAATGGGGARLLWSWIAARLVLSAPAAAWAHLSGRVKRESVCSVKLQRETGACAHATVHMDLGLGRRGLAASGLRPCGGGSALAVCVPVSAVGGMPASAVATRCTKATLVALWERVLCVCERLGRVRAVML